MYEAFIAVSGPTFVKATAVQGGYTAQVPSGFAGQRYVILTCSDDTVTDDNVAAGPAIVEVFSIYSIILTLSSD